MAGRRNFKLAKHKKRNGTERKEQERRTRRIKKKSNRNQGDTATKEE